MCVLSSEGGVHFDYTVSMGRIRGADCTILPGAAETKGVLRPEGMEGGRTLWEEGGRMEGELPKESFSTDMVLLFCGSLLLPKILGGVEDSTLSSCVSSLCFSLSCDVTSMVGPSSSSSTIFKSLGPVMSLEFSSPGVQMP